MDGDLSQERIETAPMMRVWGDLGPLVVELMRLQPALATRLALAPSKAIHAVAAYLHNGIAAGLSAEVLALAISTRDARDLLAEAIPSQHPRLFGLLGRVGSGTKSLGFYRELNAELSEPAADLLLEARSIRKHTIQIAKKIAADPVLRAARRSIGEDDLFLRHLTNVLELLRSLGLANHIERLPEGSGIQAIFRRIKMDMRSGKPPPVSFETPIGWDQVRDVGQLIVIGELLQNCLSVWAGDGTRYVKSFMTGSSAFFVREGPPTMLLSLDKLGPQTWCIGEFGSTGSAADDEKERAVCDFQVSLSTTGDALLATNPFAAFVEMYWRSHG